MAELKKKIEAILFSVARYISLEEISKLCKTSAEETKDKLLELKIDLENRNDTSLVLLNDQDLWKLTIREEFAPLIKSVVTETELTKSQLETLAIIAFKYPLKQADLIKIRTNKAYDHLLDLEKAGFIIRQKYGRSRLIKLTDKFFEYFDLPREKLKERFKGFEQLATTIEKKEENIEQAREHQQKIAEESKKEAEMERKLADGQIEIELNDEEGRKEALEIYNTENARIEEEHEKLGNLEIVDEDAVQDEKSVSSEEKNSPEKEKREEESSDVIAEKKEERLSDTEETDAEKIKDLFHKKEDNK